MGSLMVKRNFTTTLTLLKLIARGEIRLWYPILIIAIIIAIFVSVIATTQTYVAESNKVVQKLIPKPAINISTQNIFINGEKYLLIILSDLNDLKFIKITCNLTRNISSINLDFPYLKVLAVCKDKNIIIASPKHKFPTPSYYLPSAIHIINYTVNNFNVFKTLSEHLFIFILGLGSFLMTYTSAMESKKPLKVLIIMKLPLGKALILTSVILSFLTVTLGVCLGVSISSLTLYIISVISELPYIKLTSFPLHLIIGFIVVTYISTYLGLLIGARKV